MSILDKFKKKEPLVSPNEVLEKMMDEKTEEDPVKNSSKLRRPARIEPRWVFQAPWFGELALGNMTVLKVYVSTLMTGGLVVGIEGGKFQAYLNNHRKEGVTPEDVAEDFGLNVKSDAKNFADFINAHLGTLVVHHGDYIRKFCL